MIWFTSDLHLGHKNIAGPSVSNWKDGYRDFDSVEQMDNEILGQINSLVAPEDTLYILGDISFKGNDTIKNYRNRIACQDIIYIRGNHDKRSSIVAAFGHCHEALEVDIEGVRFCLSHYAHRVWNKSHHGSIHLYGHSHGRLEYEPWGKSMDVGVDAAYAMHEEYRPFALEEILKIMGKRTPKLIDHHGTSRDKAGKSRQN